MAQILHRPGHVGSGGVVSAARDDLLGYKDRMDTFFPSKPDMRSRIAHHLDFPDDFDRDRPVGADDLSTMAEADIRANRMSAAAP